MTTVLVTGATGTVGSEVVRQLGERGVPVRAFVRDPDRARAILGGDVEVAVGDFAEPDTIEVALKGVDRVFLACNNDPRQVEYESNVIDGAARAGVQRIVKLSAVGAQPGSPLAFWDAQGRIEGHLAQSRIPAVVLQPTFHMSNLLASAEGIRGTGQLFLPAADAKVAMIDPRDVAAAAAAAVDGAGDDGRRYRLTGPEALTFGSVADQLSEAIGYTVELIDVPDEAAHAAMLGAGIPAWIAENLVTLFGFLRGGAGEATTEDVRELTGNDPRTFAEFARDHAELFARYRDEW